MPTVPMLDPSQVGQEKGLMGGKGLTPEHLLMAAAGMHDMGRLVDSGGGLPRRMKGPSQWGIKHRARGGGVEEGEAYMVGEDGPELFVPEGKGKIVTNTKLAMMKKRDIIEQAGGRGEGGAGGGLKPAPDQGLKAEAKTLMDWAKQNPDYAKMFEKGSSKGSALFKQEPIGPEGFNRPAPKTSSEEIAQKAIDNIYGISQDFVNKHTPSKAGGMRSMTNEEWMGLRNKYVSPQKIPESAREAGFNPNYPLVKGGDPKQVQEWTPEGGGRWVTQERTKLHDPSKKRSERGSFFAEDPEIARSYGDRVDTYVARPKNPAVIDLKGEGYDSSTMHRIVEDARSRGHDLLVIRNIKDVGSWGDQNQIVVTNPAIVRSPKAKFDPDTFHINDLLASILGFAGLGAAAKGRKDNGSAP